MILNPLINSTNKDHQANQCLMLILNSNKLSLACLNRKENKNSSWNFSKRYRNNRKKLITLLRKILDKFNPSQYLLLCKIVTNNQWTKLKDNQYSIIIAIKIIKDRVLHQVQA